MLYIIREGPLCLVFLPAAQRISDRQTERAALITYLMNGLHYMNRAGYCLHWNNVV